MNGGKPEYPEKKKKKTSLKIVSQVGRIYHPSEGVVLSVQKKKKRTFSLFMSRPQVALGD